MEAIKREDFDIIMPSSRAKSSDKTPPLPPKKGEKTLETEPFSKKEEDVQEVKDWGQIKNEMEKAGLTGDQKQESKKGSEGDEKGEGDGSDFVQFEEGDPSEYGQEEAGDSSDGSPANDSDTAEVDADSGIPGETEKQKSERIKRTKIKSHNTLVGILNNVKGFYVKNEKIMSSKIKEGFEKKINQLEGVVKESEADLKNTK